MKLTNERLAELTERVNERIAEFGEAGVPYFEPMRAGIVRLVYDVIEEWGGDNHDADHRYLEGYAEGLAEGGKIGADVMQAENMWRLVRDAGGRLMERTPWEANGDGETTVPSREPVAGDDPATLADAAIDDERCDDGPLIYIDSTADNLLSTNPEHTTPYFSDPVIDPETAATLGPEHFHVTPYREPDDPHHIGPRKQRIALPAPSHPWKNRVDGRPNSPLPPPPDPDVAREKLATALTDASNGMLASVLNRPRALAEVDKAAERAAKRRAQLDEIVTALRAMAVDGAMPSQAEWSANKPAHLPIWQSISPTHNLSSWGDLAREAGLKWDTSRRGRPRKEGATPKRASTLPTVEELVAFAKEQSSGTGIMPSMVRFDENRPLHWLTAAQCVNDHSMTWAQLAEAAGLKVAGRVTQAA